MSDKSRVLCKYHMSGVCRFGSDCAFSHDLTDLPNLICKFYLAGCCAYGDRCRYDHKRPEYVKAKQNHRSDPPGSRQQSSPTVLAVRAMPTATAYSKTAAAPPPRGARPGGSIGNGGNGGGGGSGAGSVASGSHPNPYDSAFGLHNPRELELLGLPLTLSDASTILENASIGGGGGDGGGGSSGLAAGEGRDASERFDSIRGGGGGGTVAPEDFWKAVVGAAIGEVDSLESYYPVHRAYGMYEGKDQDHKDVERNYQLFGQGFRCDGDDGGDKRGDGDVGYADGGGVIGRRGGGGGLTIVDDDVGLIHEQAAVARAAGFSSQWRDVGLMANRDVAALELPLRRSAPRPSEVMEDKRRGSGSGSGSGSSEGGKPSRTQRRASEGGGAVAVPTAGRKVASLGPLPPRPGAPQPPRNAEVGYTSGGGGGGGDLSRLMGEDCATRAAVMAAAMATPQRRPADLVAREVAARPSPPASSRWAAPQHPWQVEAAARTRSGGGGGSSNSSGDPDDRQLESDTAIADVMDPAEVDLCRRYLLYGRCAAGDACPLVHGLECEICGKFQIHPYNPEAAEEHRAACRMRHELLDARRRSSGVECAICLESVLSKPSVAEQRFGLLSACDHAFCLACIRSWRGRNEDTSLATDTAVRTCPICRLPSHFVTPSLVWPATAEDKAAVMKAYRDKLATIDCRHFNFGEGTCPFSTSCFYRHMYKDGRMEELVLRRAGNADGEVRVVRPVRLSAFFDTPVAQRALGRRR